MADEIVAEKPMSVIESVRAAVAEHADAPDAPAVAAAAEVPVPASADSRARDESGRFATKPADAKPRETLTLKTGSEAQPAPVKPGTEAAPKPLTAGSEPPKEPAAAPTWWKGAGKIDWKRLPAPIQQEMSEFVGRLESERAEVAPLKEMLDLNRDTLVREAGSVQEGIRQLLAFHQLSLEKPLDLIQHIARSRGIDLRAALAGQPQAQPGNPQQPPDLNSLVAQAIQQHLAPIQQQEQQRQYNQNLQTVQTFANDPAHPYFNDVADQMEALLKGGIAKDLSDAYDKATKLNPTISGQLDQERQKAADDQRKADADKARKATAASVRGSPVPDVSRGNGGGPKSVRDAVREAFSEHGAA